MNRETWTAEIESDVFQIPHPEDGDMVTGEELRITVTNERGDRFAHQHSWKTLRVCGDGNLLNSRDEAVLATAHLINRIDAAIAAGTWAGPRDNPHWEAGCPVYGSAAYVAGDWSRIDAELEHSEN